MRRKYAGKMKPQEGGSAAGKMNYFNGFPKWVLKHYGRIKENNGVCDIPDCDCHWIDSLNKRKEST
jgi:hypothetical protein